MSQEWWAKIGWEKQPSTPKANQAKLGAILRDHLRHIDIVCRYGGEEFVVLLVENDQKAARTVAERLCHLIGQQPFNTTAGEIQVTVSIGVATLDEGMDILNTLIEAGDRALYQAKTSGRNRVVAFEPSPAFKSL